MISALMREKRRILRNLEGVRTMSKLPGALVVIDPRREIIAVREANKLDIPVVALLDTDSDPDLIDIPIPGNDDAIRSIQLITHALANAVLEGRVGKVEKAEAAAGQAPEEAKEPAAAAPEKEEPAEAPAEEAPQETPAPEDRGEADAAQAGQPREEPAGEQVEGEETGEMEEPAEAESEN